MGAHQAGVGAIVCVLGDGLREVSQLGVERAIISRQFQFLRVTSFVSRDGNQTGDVLGQCRQSNRPLRGGDREAELAHLVLAIAELLVEREDEKAAASSANIFLALEYRDVSFAGLLRKRPAG